MRGGQSVRLGGGLTNLEALFEVFVFFQESSIVDDDLSVGNSEFQDLVINRLCGFDGPNGLLEIDVE